MDIMLSALQHYAFCPRQCALIHLEQVWEDNEHTAEGTLMHENAHGEKSRMRNGVKIASDLELRSTRLGLRGRADVVEFHRARTMWTPYPVEYKKGHPHKGNDADAVQLCAQALCLEEMLDVQIQEGALFYGEARRRRVVQFDEHLRQRTGVSCLRGSRYAGIRQDSSAEGSSGVQFLLVERLVPAGAVLPCSIGLSAKIV